MSKSYIIGSKDLSLKKINEIIDLNMKVSLDSKAKKQIIECCSYLESKIYNSDTPIYGVNTGFGALCNNKISSSELSDLQKNLVLSHACGTGEEVPHKIVKIMLLLKIQTISYGKSGVQIDTVNRLIDMFNRNILPVVYQQGSLGASGDLAPLAHMCLPLLGEGEVNLLNSNNSFDKKIQSSQLLSELNWQPIALQSKEGLALLNGTQFMSAYAVWCLLKSKRLSYFSDLISSISIDAFNCNLDPFNHLIHQSRPHPGNLKLLKT